jgi:hypothetical protein
MTTDLRYAFYVELVFSVVSEATLANEHVLCALVPAKEHASLCIMHVCIRVCLPGPLAAL